jgi:histidine ammonia-lyase
MEKFILKGKELTIDNVYKIAHSSNKDIQVSLCPDAEKRIIKARECVLNVIKNKKVVYGINTGFGALSNVHIADHDLTRLQYNLIRSHCTGVGKPFSREIVRAIILLRANCLAAGHSGVNLEIVQLLINFLNKDIIPVIPEKGSVGASGDLAPLSHLALTLIGEGEVFFENKIVNSNFAIFQSGLQPVILGPKDGLALINGTSVMAALACLAISDAHYLIKSADIAAAISLEAVRGTKNAYHPLITKLKPHRGQEEVVKNLNLILTESEIMKSHENCGKVQDPYSFRCIPQVHGSIRQTLYHAHEVVTTEINSVTDNPLIFPDEDLILSGGNFHGEALALCMDYLSMGLTEIANICERRVEKMVNPHFSDLPAFLTKNSGLNSGMMIAHVTIAALASENKYLSHPASVDSIPTSTDKEDHVSMGVTAGLKLLQIIENVKNCLAIEFLCNTQGIDLLRPLKSNEPIEKVMTLIRNHVQFIEEDRVLSTEIAKIKSLIERKEILNTVESVCGVLN